MNALVEERRTPIKITSCAILFSGMEKNIILYAWTPGPRFLFLTLPNLGFPRSGGSECP